MILYVHYFICIHLTSNNIFNKQCMIKLVQLEILVQNMKEKLDSKQKEAAAWKAKYNIKTQEEAEAAKRQ